MEGLTPREVKEAKTARRAMEVIGYPSERDLDTMVRGGFIRYCPVTTKGITHANKISGPHVKSLKGKTVRRPPEPVVTEYFAVPRHMHIWDAYRPLTLIMDIFYVNELPFLLSIMRRLQFTTVEYVRSQGDKTLCACI